MRATTTKAPTKAEGGQRVPAAGKTAVPESPQRMPLWADTVVPIIQYSLKVNPPADKYEREADRVAEKVMRMPEPSVQRKTCACGRPMGPDGMCEECKRKRLKIQRKENGDAGGTAAPAIVNQVLAQPGRLLDMSARNYMESRFGQDFGGVRVHTDGLAERSAWEMDALAYTVGQNVVFGSGQYRPNSSSGRQLLAHELTHVVQQGGARISSSFDALKIDALRSSTEMEAHIPRNSVGSGLSADAGNAQPRLSAPVVSRAEGDPVDRVGALGRTLGSGIQFFPTNLAATVVGPVSVRGGLLSSGASRLNVIIGENMTPRILARQILPLWTTATPFTPPGGGAPVPLDIIDDEILAKGLLVYNRFFLTVPSMIRWRPGLRFPLPVEIDEATGIGTLHPSLIRSMAGAFDTAWTPLLDLHAAAAAAVPAARLAISVTDFLARETSAMARGMHLGARAVTNALAELPFIREAFNQLGSGGFDVALALMDSLVNREVALLASQRDGAAILAEVQTALGTAPATVTADQQASLDRANLMLGRVTGVTAVAPPTARRTRAEKTVTVDTLKLVGSNHNPAADIAVANAIFSQCNVRIAHGVDADDTTAAAPQTTTWLSGDTDLRSGNNCASPSGEERAIFRDASSHYGLGSGDFSAFFVETFSGTSGSGYSCRRGLNPHLHFRNKIVVRNNGDTDTLAHELGHHLINSRRHKPASSIMSGRPRRTVELTDWQCNRVYSNA